MKNTLSGGRRIENHTMTNNKNIEFMEHLVSLHEEMSLMSPEFNMYSVF